MRRREYTVSALSVGIASVAGCSEDNSTSEDGSTEDCGPGSTEIDSIYNDWDVFAGERVSIRGQILTVQVDSDDFGSIFMISDSTGNAQVIPSRDNVDDIHQLEEGMCVSVSGEVPSTDSAYYQVGQELNNIIIVDSGWSYSQ